MINTENLDRHVTTLENSILLINKCKKGSIEYDVFRNAVIKGFELTLKTSGKLLRKALKQYFADPREVDSLVFKDVLRAGAKHNILSADEVERWFGYRDNRNTTAHDYGEGFAEETLTLMPDFISDVRRLIKALNNGNY